EVGAGFHPDLTGRENVFLNGTILGMRRREIVDRFDDIVEFSGMANFIDTPVKRYSSGMYARLGFSVAAFMDPDVLLIDEVLSVGDIAFSRKCERKIQEIVSGDTTVLFVSHNLAAVRMICERVIVLRAGEVIFDGPSGPAIHRYHEMLAEEENNGQAHASLRSIKFGFGEDGDNLAQTEPGGVVTLDAELVAAEAITEATIGFSLQDERGQELYEVRSEEIGAEPADLAPGDSLRVRFRFSANLLPGVYWVGSAVRGRPRGSIAGEPECLEYTPNRMQLEVAGASEGRGSANLFATCAPDFEAASIPVAARVR
ncbi:MAG TPA: Wzt carbohydrate-binding domain-containing protein, partial [Planctomycetia bacterium]|nr:Wzt carbohydrate-binding domain-containing protein [Planctomycetia bacterium]